LNTEIIGREAPAWVWEIVDSCLAKSRTPQAKKAQEVLQASANAAQQEWDASCWRFGLTPKQFGTTFSFRGKRYTVIGLKPRSSRFPILARNEVGSVYKFPADVLK
jgi:predicted metal-dependent peptidase